MRLPAVLLAIPVIAGSVAGFLLSEASPPIVSLLTAGASAVAFVAAFGAVVDEDSPVATCAIVIAALLASWSLGTRASVAVYNSPARRWFDAIDRTQPHVVEGTLREDAALTAFGATLVLDGLRLSVGGRGVAERLDDWRAGRAVRVAATVREPAVYRNPGVTDDARAMARRGTPIVGSVKSAALVEVVARGSALNEVAASGRALARRRIATHVAPLSERSAAVATAILIGDRSALDRDDVRRLQEAGTYHVIAISGGNIAILTLLVFGVLRAFRAPQPLAGGITIVALLFYGQIAGGSASVQRAIAVAVIFLAARMLDHRPPPLNALAVAGGAAVAWWPVTALDPGFILSFGATLALIAGVPRMVPFADRGTSLPRRFVLAIVAMLAATLCAEIALAPAGAVLFSRVTFAGFVLNFAAIPLMTIVQLASMVVVFAGDTWIAGTRIAAVVVHYAAEALVESAWLVDVAPWLAVDVRAPAWPLVATYYVCAAALLNARLRRWAATGLAMCATLILAAPAATSRDAIPASSLPLRVVIFDVGQGDASLVTFGGRALLIDAGGLPTALAATGPSESPAFDIGERVLAPALRAFGVWRLETFVLTHGDPDHMQGAPAILRGFRPSSAWDGVAVPPHQPLRALLAQATAQGMTWRTVRAGDEERHGPVTIRVLHPPAPDWERQRVRNEDSVVLDVRIGEVSIILPGDIGTEGEQAILPRLDPARLVVLKAPHHGSATSSTQPLLDALRPAAAIFSAGRNNRFGHPHPAVVGRYRRMGTAMFNTAEDGAVIVESDGGQVVIRGWWSGRTYSATAGKAYSATAAAR